MANPEHVEIVKQGAEAIAKWRAENPGVRLDLAGTDLRGAYLRKANLAGAFLDNADLGNADLSRAYLRDADLGEANLSKADLHHADLRRANLIRAVLSMANLSGADLCGAYLHRINLVRAVLSEANLAGAYLDEANLAGAILREVRGMEQVYRLEAVRFISPEASQHSGVGNDAYAFETCRRRWPERWLDWERLRVVGRLPLFGISYTALILIPIVFYGLALYNRNIDLVHIWAKEAIILPDHPLHRLAPPILERLHHLPIPSLSFVLFVSTILLAIASTLYT